MKCLLCHQVIDFSDEKEMSSHMKDIHKAIFDVKLLIAIHFLTPVEKVIMINKTDKMIRERKSKMTKKMNIVQNVLRRSLRKRNRSRSPRPDSKSSSEEIKLEKSPKAIEKFPRDGTKSVLDKISIFEKGEKKKPHVEKGRYDLLSKNWTRMRHATVPDVGLKVDAHELGTDIKENVGNDTLRNFDEMLANTTVNLDNSTTSFYDILEDNKIVDENCFDITISDIK